MTTPIALPHRPAATAIIKALSTITTYTGYGAHDVFRDWLLAVETALHCEAGIHTTCQATFKTLGERYKGRMDTDGGLALGELLLATRGPDGPTYTDVLGPIYMTYGHPNEWAGQFFTPAEVSSCMAEMMMHDAEAEIRARLETEPFVPFRFLEPCVGAGGMILAAAKACPRWILDYGLIRFYANDVDPQCVRMARINCVLAELNLPPRPAEARAYLARQMESAA